MFTYVKLPITSHCLKVHILPEKDVLADTANNTAPNH